MHHRHPHLTLQVGASVNVDVLKFREADLRAYLRVLSSNLVRLWSSLTLTSCYNGRPCSFRVYKVFDPKALAKYNCIASMRGAFPFVPRCPLAWPRWPCQVRTTSTFRPQRQLLTNKCSGLVFASDFSTHRRCHLRSVLYEGTVKHLRLLAPHCGKTVAELLFKA